MAIKFQYNKISLQEMQKQLAVRLDTLPVLRYKETVLRMESEKAKRKMKLLEEVISEKIKQYEYMNIMWKEFPKDVMTLSEIKTSMKNIAGVKAPQFEEAVFGFKPVCLFNKPLWISEGIVIVKELALLTIEKKLLRIQTEMLVEARKKTTQKVNLYEKVQVPAYLEAISKIKKYLSDAESLDKASQKIMKKRILSFS